MDDGTHELVDEELFDPDRIDQVTAVVWWLVHLLGGKVAFPMDEDFWVENYPENSRLVMRVENGVPHLFAEKLDWEH